MKNPSKQYAAFVSKVEPSSTLNLPEEIKLRGTIAKIGDYLRAWEAAVYLGISESTLAKLRMRNNRSSAEFARAANDRKAGCDGSISTGCPRSAMGRNKPRKLPCFAWPQLRPLTLSNAYNMSCFAERASYTGYYLSLPS